MPTITHTIAEPWRSHLRDGLAALNTLRNEELRLLGLAHEAREQANHRRASLEEIVRLIAREAELPDVSYTISKDGSTLTGEAPDTSHAT